MAFPRRGGSQAASKQSQERAVASGERREREEGSASKDQFNGLMWRASDLFIVSSNTLQEAFPFKLKHPLLIRIRNLVFLNELDVVMFDMRILIFVEKSSFLAIQLSLKFDLGHPTPKPDIFYH